MIKKFIAFNKDDNKMWSAQDLLDNGYIFTFDGEVRLESFCGTQGDVCNEFTVYQYIHRKDKDGNKVYDGSKVSFLFKDGRRYSGIVEYYAMDSSYIIAFNRCSSCRVGQSRDIKVIGHIAEEAPNEPNNTLP